MRSVVKSSFRFHDWLHAVAGVHVVLSDGQALVAFAAVVGSDVSAYEKQIAHNPIGRVVDAREVPDVIAFLASPRSISITGDAVAVGGGLLGTINY